MGDPVNLEVLIELTDWEQMKLKSGLKYRADFLIVSAAVWKFLQAQFGGGTSLIQGIKWFYRSGN